MLKYSVQTGDTYSGIARRFGVSINEVLAVNPQISNPAFIIPGMVINIPSHGSLAYTIQQGDTLYLISNKFKISLSSLFQANPGINPINLYTVMQIFIPVNPTNIFPTYNIVGSSVYINPGSERQPS